MKKSNILIICLIAFSFIAMIGSGLTLKSQFDKIDRKDPYYLFDKTTLGDFKYIRLSGNYHGTTKIMHGTEPKIMVAVIKNDDKTPIVTWKMSRDTLVINYKMTGNVAGFEEHQYDQLPNVYVVAPHLSGVFSQGITTFIENIKADSFALEQKGFGVILKDNNFKKLTSTVISGANLTIVKKNNLEQTKLRVTDSSSVHIESDTFRSFQLTTDDSVQLNFPASLFKKITTL
ncbi:MAG TPA: hypothetical protein VGN64_13100 [Dyadobacter sp.]|nr:hypothetical protein [Dyadobacter sp.]